MKNKIFAIFVTLIMALAVAGFAYGNWFSTVNITGNVTTGKLELTVWDFWVYNQTGSAVITPSYPVARDLTLTITNTYPGWHAYVVVRFKNTGTIPLKFYSFGLTYNSGTYDLLNYYKLGFLYPSGTDYAFNYGPATLAYYLTTHYYATEFGGMGYPAGFTMNPEDLHDNMLYIGLDSSLEIYQNTNLNVTFWVTATQYIP